MYIIILILLILIIWGPQIWAKRILAQYAEHRESFPDTGVGFSRYILEKMKIPEVTVEVTDAGDHYDPVEKVIRLNSGNCEKKSLTAVVVATHEVGHAIQDHTGYQPLQARTKLIFFAETAEKIGAGLIVAIPIVALVTRVPVMGGLMFMGGLATLGIPVLVHLITLPVEWDASFRRALPILAAYLPSEDRHAARRILTACALTYVAGSLASLLNFWRWIRILQR